MNAELVRIKVSGTETVSGRLLVPEQAFACYVLAHGAGAGMEHPFMRSVADGLSHRGMATLRYQFPYMEHGSKRPDRPALAHAAVRAAVSAAAAFAPSLPIFAGGKSFGGRMTSQAQSEEPLAGVAGLVFLGFPLHPAGKPSRERARHLADVHVPMLFLQGTRDALADERLLTEVHETLSDATLHFIANADHSFHVPARTGVTDTQVLNEALDVLVHWARARSVPVGSS
jgi:predicted alpha/beta-hydrolase family hydrolase